MNLSNYDAIVVGAGFSGATAAEILSRAGKNVAVLERRNHIGGNMYETRLADGTPRVHLYGPHIFHTNNEDKVLRELGEFVYEKVFVHYTAKQWGIPAEKVDRGTIDRVPVRIGYDDRYFADAFQAMPVDGYSPIFEKMLEKADVFTGVDGRCALGYGKPVIYTGPLDELFDFEYGALPYRTLRLDFETLDMEQYQPAAVVNYPNEEDFTRITEFKALTGEKLPCTTILREYPAQYVPGKGEPYYPIASGESAELYERYARKAAQVPGLVLCGRLAEYKYYNMDQCIARAMEITEKLLAAW